MKILLVDDSEMMRHFVVSLLSKPGRECLQAASLVEAVDSYCKARPAAVLMDFVLENGHTGLEALAAIFALCGPIRPVAAILTQGALTAADQAKAASWQVQVFQKPIKGKEHEFVATIEGWLASLSSS